MGAESACPVCGASLGAPRAACWLCRHPIPERTLPPPAPPQFAVPPAPEFERRREDRLELDRTSVCIGIGLIIATIGAFGVNGKGGTLVAVLALLPVLYLGVTFAVGDGADRVPPPPGRPWTFTRVVEAVAVVFSVFVLVVMAVFVALFITCLVAMSR